jgi:hypothetical protein
MDAIVPNAIAPDLNLPSVRDQIDSMSPQQIEQRRNEIIAAARGDYENLSTLMLHELSYIAAKLRKTNVGPPKEPKQKRKATLDDLF